TNAFVIDIKDERLAYESNVARELCPTAYDWAYTSMDVYKKAVQEIKDAGIYTIGRIVVFSDEDYADDHPEDCIESVYSGGQWPSAFDRDVWEYNVKLAVEAVEELGFDEIQLDYVRFPESSWQMSENDPDVDFKNQYGEEKAQAVQGFIFYAADKIHEAGAYLSVDVFGECAGEYVTAYGQYWPAISNIVDAISGMPYTDHYGETDTWSYPYNIMATFASMAAERQKEIPTPAIVRTWITGYDTPNWDPVVVYDEEKLVDQITALYDYGLDGGFIPWHGASNINKYWQYAGIWSRDYKSSTAGGETVTPDEAQEEEQPETDEQ
ncbi:MAG: hypothetical protein HUJ75_00370, partial [Parasporobacterium sp.]|nr:hypothetical protein [Parasporobacterium sp.]